VIGFSDITALHLKLSSLGVESVHGTMPILFSKTDSASSIESLRKVLFDEPHQILAPAHSLNRLGHARGPLVGGNLSLIVDSLGTAYEPEIGGKILIIEEVDEYLYKIDRMIVQLKRAGKLEGLAGLVIGHFSEIKDTELSFGETVEQIIRFHTSIFQYPVAFNFPSGHLNPNLSWVQGRQADLTVDENGSTLLHSR
jgi:muramoyltetrapeptide carboxypeptidase